MAENVTAIDLPNLIPACSGVTRKITLITSWSYVDSLHECPDNFSSAVPVCACQVRSDGCRQLAKTIRCKSKVFQLIDIACTRSNFGIKISDSSLGPSHPRRELVFVNQTSGEAIDQPFHSML